jgi:hypothetical protein
MRLTLISPLLCVLFCVSCTRLPPPVLKSSETPTVSANDLSGGLAPIVKPVRPGISPKPERETRLSMGEEESGTWRMSLEGADALEIFGLLGIRAEEAGGVYWKRGRDLVCGHDASRSFCEWRIRAPFGRIVEVRPLDQVLLEAQGGRQRALETPYVGIPAVEWGRKARIKIALGFAERIFESMSAAQVLILPAGGGPGEGLRRLGEQVNCLKVREASRTDFRYGCYLRIDLLNGRVDKADPDQQD